MIVVFFGTRGLKVMYRKKVEGKKCRVVIKHTKTDAGDVWENVTDVMKAAQRAFDEI